MYHIWLQLRTPNFFFMENICNGTPKEIIKSHQLDKFIEKELFDSVVQSSNHNYYYVDF